MTEVSPRRRKQVIDSLRRGTVPAQVLDLLAVGLERFLPTLDGELDAVAGGGASFKAVRGEYGSGKTFVTRFFAERALRRGFAAAEVHTAMGNSQWGQRQGGSAGTGLARMGLGTLRGRLAR